MRNVILVVLCGLWVVASAEQVAVLALRNNGGVTDGEINIMTDRIEYSILNHSSMTVVNRREIDEILKEQGFQQSGACNDESCIIQVGQLLATQKIISGSIGKLGSLYSVNLKIYDVRTGKLLNQETEDVSGSKENILKTILPRMTDRLLENKTVSSTPAANQPTASVKHKRWPLILGVTTGVVVIGGVVAAYFLLNSEATHSETPGEILVQPPAR